MIFAKRHLGDIAKGCAHLSQGEFGAYNLLMDWCYSTERALPLLVTDLYRIGRATTKQERKNVDRVVAELFDKTDAGYTQKRVVREIEKANAIAETNRRIAVEREERRRLQREGQHELFNEPLHASCSVREPIQTPDTRHQTTYLENTESDKTPKPPPAQAARSEDSTLERTANALTAAGCDTRKHDPRLEKALADGITHDELVSLASSPKGKGKSLPYLISTICGQRQDAANAPGAGQSGSRTSPPADLEREEAIREQEDVIIAARHLASYGHADGAECNQKIAAAQQKLADLRSAIKGSGDARPVPLATGQPHDAH